MENEIQKIIYVGDPMGHPRVSQFDPAERRTVLPTESRLSKGRGYDTEYR